MKNLSKIALVVLLASLMVPKLIYSQNSFCFTPPYSLQNNFNSFQLNDNSFNTNYCIKIYIHVIRKSNGTDGQSYQSVQNAINILNSDFNPYNINFVWDNSIDYIDNTSYFNTPSSSIFSVNNHSDGIDIYLYDESSPAGGLANGVGNSSELYVSGLYWGEPNISLIESHVISHEMGHVLFLWHTHHGTYNEGGNDNPCPELVNGNNGIDCGDYVYDTPADPHLQFNVNYPECEWNSSGVDQNGDSYHPDEKNIMAYTNVSCMQYFTMQQGLRMRSAISSLSHLQSTVVEQCCIGLTLDLYMKDRYDDNGNDAGYSFTWDYDESPDIWVRNQDDGLVNHTHQQPEYNPNNPVYVYVRVGNKSCVPSTGSEKIGLYWSKASSWSSWPQNWDGTDPDVGNQIDAINIPVLQAGESTILKFIWHINPNTGVGTEWANCLLARIENSETDPITVHPEYLPDDVYQNNNVSMRNCIVTNYIADMNLDQLSFYIGNPISVDKEIDVLFRVPDQTDKPITDVAEVTVQLNKEGWEILREALENIPGIRPKNDYSFSILDQEIVALENIDFPANTRIPVKIRFNFLTKKVDEHHTYRYHVIQKLSKPHPELGDRWTGGIHFTINKGLRTLFEADAGIDKEIDKGENVILSAEQINEAAVYNWYDPQGNLIYTGRDLSISPEISNKYKLEVIADTDGFKDYDEVEVVVNSYHIISISPNPSSDHITVTYNAEGAGSAYLMIIGTTDFVSSNNYLLDCTQIQTNIDISSYQTGIYTVALVKDGYIVDVKTIMKN